VLTGYNTDIDFDGVTYHVQTEDRGGGNPLIESLVYVGGEILAARRTEYRNLLEVGAEKSAIQTLMEHQHRAIVDAIKNGRITVLTEPQVGAESDTTVKGRSPLQANTVVADAANTLPRSQKTLDEVIAEWLAEQQRTERIRIAIEGGADLSLGAAFALAIVVRTTPGDAPVAGAQVFIRFLSTATKPVKLAEGRTDDAGKVSLRGSVPDIERGTALVVVTAQHASGSDEAKFLVKH
jgi:hypothetical protein